MNLGMMQLFYEDTLPQKSEGYVRIMSQLTDYPANIHKCYKAAKTEWTQLNDLGYIYTELGTEIFWQNTEIWTASHSWMREMRHNLQFKDAGRLFAQTLVKSTYGSRFG